ncbi:MAG: Eco57I restriction-modification methylase domain-containing protein [Gemmatimonadaceae bacterium]|nr:Eco57I restriction-modification methylase domain-containing protein [Gemmatimonadaceae bacterium]
MSATESPPAAPPLGWLIRRAAEDLLAAVEEARLTASARLNQKQRGAKGQYFTPAQTARFMASQFTPRGGRIRLLDAGAGVGSLSAAWIAQAAQWESPPEHIHVTAFELEPLLAEYLEATFSKAAAVAAGAGVGLSWEVRGEDFIESASASAVAELFAQTLPRYDVAILNPPYHKIRSDSKARETLRRAGIETSNLYSAFVWLAVSHLTRDGELVAITPRSFCNGPYFRPFRKYLLEQSSLDWLHVYESRDTAFADDEVLQETLIFKVTRAEDQRSTVTVSSSEAGHEHDVSQRQLPYGRVVLSDDRESVIHLPDEEGEYTASFIRQLPATLRETGLSVSTGKVVDFRCREQLRSDASADTVPLIYPQHFLNGRVEWPKTGAKKPNALQIHADVESLLVPAGYYVLVKRFSAKEERRRVTAAVFDPSSVACEQVGFENHLNYFHAQGAPLNKECAFGLAAYLNSTLLDDYFRTFNGHTQVNASDLKSLPYPSRAQLQELGRLVLNSALPQPELDTVVEEHLFKPQDSEMPSAGAEKILEATEILRALGLPNDQLNDRSALTLLALADVHPDSHWLAASQPMIGVTPIMDFARDRYGKQYAPNTRETFRRFTLHQFVEAGLVRANPDDPNRPVNSPKYCYQLTTEALTLIRHFGTKAWLKALEAHKSALGELKMRWAAEREMQKIPITLPQGGELALSPGGQNELVKLIVREFLPRFTPGGHVVYLGDTEQKDLFYDRECLRALGVTPLDDHGKMPDVVVHFAAKDWLVLIEAVTSHGPVNPKRQEELKRLFGKSRAGLVFVSTFLTRQDLSKYLRDIAWETDVWVAEAPSHMLHFNGERFLGPY